MEAARDSLVSDSRANDTTQNAGQLEPEHTDADKGSTTVQREADQEGADAAGMDNVPSADFALQKSYAVWAMVKQQKHQIDMSETYQVANKVVAKFKTVGEFWQVQSHLRRPSVMPIGTFLHFFVEGIKPLWEDDHCKDGGRWTIKLPKTHTAKYWEELILAMIGEQFDEVASDEVLGLVLALKFNHDQISIWHRNAQDPATVAKVKSCIESTLGSSAFNKQGAKGCDLSSCIENGVIKLDHENFKEILSQSSLNTPREKKSGFHTEKNYNYGFEKRGRGSFRGARGGFSGRGGHRHFGGPQANDGEEENKDDDFQTVTMAKK